MYFFRIFRSNWCDPRVRARSLGSFGWSIDWTRDRSAASGDRPTVTRLAFVLPLAIDRLVGATDRRNLWPNSSLARSIDKDTRSIACPSGFLRQSSITILQLIKSKSINKKGPGGGQPVFGRKGNFPTRFRIFRKKTETENPFPPDCQDYLNI